MRHIIVIINIIFYLLPFNQIRAQDYKSKKETVYMILKQKDSCLNKYNELLSKDANVYEVLNYKFYSNIENGIIFNLYCEKNTSFLFKNGEKSDTLCINLLNKYKISTSDDIDKKILNFRKKTFGKFPKNKRDKLYQAYDKNDLFYTYLIEILDQKDKFVIYPVVWRNQGITE